MREGPARAKPQAEPAGNEAPSKNKRVAVSPWLAAGILAAAAAALTFDPKLYINGDNVDYILLARSVRHGLLWASDKYPPLFPILLAPVQALSGMGLIPQKLLVLGFFIGSLWFLSRIVRRRAGGKAAPLVFLACATMIPIIEYAHYTMSEIPYMFFLLGAIDACDRLLLRDGRRGSWKDRALWPLALWIAAGFYARSAGLVVGAACLIVLLMSRRRRDAAHLAVLLLVLGVPWLLHSLLAGGSPYVRQLLQVNPYYPEFGMLTPASLWRRVGENIGFYGLQEAPSTILPLFYASTYSPPGQGYLPVWLGAPLLLPLAAGLIASLRRRDPAAAVLLLTFLLCLVWPLIWTGSRFLVPVVPLLLLFWWMGWSLRSGPIWTWARRVVLVVLLLLSVRNLVFYKLETEEYPPVWANYFAALDWIGKNTPQGSVVIDRKPGFVEYVAERKGVGFPREKDPDRMLRFFHAQGADYVVLSALPYDDIGRYLRPAVERRLSSFAPVFQSGSPFTYVLRFQPGGEARNDPPPAGGATGAEPRAPAPGEGD
jgi:4-amino-4-deoxy-L-arabinose transferase-like glycosyltransferase